MAMALLRLILTGLAFLPHLVSAEEEPACVDLLQHQLHLQDGEDVATRTKQKLAEFQAPAAPPVSPVTKVNVLSYQVWQANTQINVLNVNQATTAAPSSWLSGSSWAGTMGAVQGLTSSIQSCLNAPSQTESSCAAPIASSALSVASQVAMLANVCVPEGVIAAGFGEILISLFNSPGSSQQNAPPKLTVGDIVNADKLANELTTCQTMTNNIVDTTVYNLQSILFDTSQNEWSETNWGQWTGQIQDAKGALAKYASQCIQDFAQDTFLGTQPYIGSFSPDCKSMCGNNDAYNSNWEQCNAGGNQLEEQLTTWEYYVNLFMNASTLLGTASSSVLATARANGYLNKPGNVGTYNAFAQSLGELTPLMQQITEIQSGMSEHCCGGASFAITEVNKCPWTQDGLKNLNYYMSQCVTSPLWGRMSLTVHDSNPLANCPECPNGWTMGECGNFGFLDAGQKVTCSPVTQCMETIKNSCYKVLKDFTLPQPANPSQTQVPSDEQLHINVTMIQQNGSCVQHISEPIVGPCSSNTGAELFAVMSKNLLWPDMSDTISSDSEAHCFYENLEGNLDIGKGKDCETGWQFQHVQPGKNTPSGTWPVQIGWNGLCWTAAADSTLVLSKCSESADQIFVLAPA